jgi:ferredoxin--NADP+ reductase
MTFVITNYCVRDGTCVEACPVNCIVPGLRNESEWPLFYIDPERRIDCKACEPVCPVGAILPDHEVPDELADSLTVNANFFKKGPGYQPFDLEVERTRFETKH